MINMIQNLKEKIEKIFKKNQQNCKILKKEKFLNNKTFLKGNFISDKFENLINKYFTNSQLISISNSNNSINVYLYTTNNKKYNIWYKDDYDILYLNMIYMLSIMELYSKKNIKIAIYFYPTNFKKIWNNNLLTPDIINSGFTSFSNNDSYIVIYRKEEYNRLLLHEMIHYLSFDRAFDNNIWSPVHMKISLDFHIYNHINLYETFTDTWAIFLMIILTNIIDPSLTINKLIKKEREHNLCMIQQLLYQMNIPDIESIKINTWIQKTSALSYYILKYGTLNMEDFINKYPLDIEWTNEKAFKFYEDIIKILEKNNIKKMNCSNSAKLSYLGYDI